MSISAPKYFLAANSCEGFVSHFESFYKFDKDYRVYILKGGPGTGKSSFMKYIAARAFDKGLKIELCPCSSDSESLDGVIIPEIKVAVLDGTAPHIIEPKLPGIREEIINLGQFWDSELLRSQADGIIDETACNKSLHTAARGYLSAAGEMLRDNLRLSGRFLNRKKCEDYAIALAKKHIPQIEEGPREDIRFITGITPRGIVSYHKTLDNYIENMIILEDSLGGASSVIMAKIREYALSVGHSIITLKNAFLPSLSIDHIIIPSLSLAFCTEHDHIKFERDARRIHSKRFYNTDGLKGFKSRISFNKRLSKELLALAVSTLNKAKASHDTLEEYYIKAMDFDAETRFAMELSEKILNI